MALFIDVVLLRYKPQFTWPGLIVVLLGIPVYYAWSKEFGRDERILALSPKEKRRMANLFAKKDLPTLMKEAVEVEGEQSLRRALGPLNLLTLGIGAIIGAGIFVITGQAAAQFAGPAIVISFVLAGIACAFAGLVLRRVCLDDPDRGQRVHVFLRHAGRIGRLDHRLGPDSGICLRRGHGGRRLERPPAGVSARYRLELARHADF